MKWIALWMIVCSFCSLPYKDVRADESGMPTATFLLTGMKDARERLRTGVFRASGQLGDDCVEDNQLHGKVEIYCAFDHSKGMLRFDRRQPERWKDVGPEIVQAPMHRFIRSPAQTVHFDENIHMLFVRGADESPKASRPWNVSVMGLMPESGLDKEFSDVYEFYANLAEPTIEAVGDRTYRLTWVNRESWGGDGRYSIWIDEKQGFSAVRYEMQHRPPGEAERSVDADWMEPSVVSEVTWFQKDDVWVPRAYVNEFRGRKGGRERLDLNLDWESVNQAIADEVFTPTTFEAPGHWRVMDERLGRPVELGRVEDLYAVVAPRTPPVPDSANFVKWGVGISIAGVLAIMLLLFWRSRRRAAV
jgi:hypothetical protein